MSFPLLPGSPWQLCKDLLGALHDTLTGKQLPITPKLQQIEPPPPAVTRELPAEATLVQDVGEKVHAPKSPAKNMSMLKQIRDLVKLRNFHPWI